MTPRPTSRLTEWVLRVALSRHRASAIVGDIAEELAVRREKDGGPRWPRLWSESRALLYLLAELRADLPPVLRGIGRVLRDSLRSLRSARATTAFILLILTVSISAATVTFSVVDTVVLRPLPFPKSEDLVVLRMGNSDGASFSTQEFLPWRQTDALTALAAYTGGGTLNLGQDSEPDPVRAANVTASLFPLLGTPPIAGRWLMPADEVSAPGDVAVIGQSLASRLFGGADAAIGQRLPTSSRTPTVVGVMPEGFSYPLDTPDPVEVWRPLAVTSERYSSGGGGMSRYFNLVGRLPPDGSPERARAALDAASAPLRATFPFSAERWPPRVVPLYDSLFGHVRGWMLLVLAAVGLLMLVACANVANLLLVRSSARARELSVRASLGASRRQLVTGLLAESVLLSLTAAVLGLIVASWGIDAARAALPEGIARADGIALDMRVLGAAIAAAAITGLAFGAVPAWQASRADLVTVLKDTGPTMAGGRRRWRTAFVVFEVAFVAVLLVATTLVVSSFVNITRADIGFERDRLIATDSVRFSGTVDSAIDTLQQIPGVESVGAIGMGSPPLIMRGLGRGGSSSVDLHRPDGRDTINAQSRRVSDTYFRAAGIALRRGSGFDRATGPSVILDEQAARALFPDRDPIGAIVRLGRPRPGAPEGDDLTVIGIVASVRMDGPEADVSPQAYLPLVRRDGSTSPLPVINGGNLQFIVRTSRPAEAMVPAIEATLAQLSPPRAGRPGPRVMVVEDAFRNLTADRRFNAGVMAIFGAVAFLIGCAGLYGVLASVVAQQTREIGVRVALGASAARIRHDVMSEAGRYLLAGLAIGLPAAWLVSRAFGSLYYGVTPADPFVYLVVAAALAVAGVLASALPARRASRVDPAIALRD